MKAVTSNKWVLLLVIFLVLSNLALVFFAFSNAHEDKKKEQGDYLISQMKLTGDQAKFFKTKKEEFLVSMRPRWEEVNLLKDSLYSHLGDANLPDSVIEYYTKTWTEKSRESDIILFKHFRELRSHCREEQKPAFDTLVPKIVTRQWRRK